jgi:tetratricopeptide (TPR) repeat protein/CHAT domain-containing protein
VVFVCVLALATVLVFAQSDDKKTWDDAVKLFNQAVGAYDQARFQDAIGLFEEALVIVRELDERYTEGAILGNLGRCYDSLSDYQRAIDYYEQALVICLEIIDQSGAAKNLYDLGLCHYFLSEYQRAIDYYEQALMLFLVIDDRAGKAMSLNNLGACYHSLVDYQRTIDYYEQALAVFREIEDWAGVAMSLNNLGLCYESLSEYWRAIDYYEQALVIFHKIDDRSGEANSLYNLGLCYKSLSDYHRAIDHYEQSLAVCLEIDDLTGAAKSLGNLGNCYHSLSDYHRAINYYEQSLAIFCDIDDRSGEAGSLGNLGIYYGSLSEYERAIDYHKQSLAIKRDIKDRVGEAGSLGNLGVCYASLYDYQRAIDYYEQSLEIFVQIDDRAGEATSLNNLGNCYVWHSDYQRAIDHYEQSLAIFREIGDRAGEAGSLNNLGVCYDSLSDYERAIDYYEQALALSVELGTRETERNVHWGLGRAYWAMEASETALTHYESAIEIVESIRGTVGEEKLRQSYFGSLRTLYEEYLELLLELGRNEETVFVAERLRARTFLDTLYQSGLAPEQLQLNEAGIVASDNVTVPVVDAKALELAVAEAQGSLLPNEAAIEYMVTDDGIYLWILTSEGTLGPEFIPYEREQLLRDVVVLRRAIEPQVKEVDGQPEVIFSDPSEPLERFYELLIQQPVLSQLADVVNTLIVIPSGPLWYVPFSALVMTDRPDVEFGSASVSGSTKQYRQRYLVDDYTLAFLPSLASLPMLMEERAPSTAMYLALANPTLSEEQKKEVGSHYQFSVLETACLAFAKCIVKGEEDVRVQKAEVYVKGDALEERAYNEAAGNEVLVYACHGIFNPRVPLDSRLLLAPNQKEEQETTDRRLADGDYYAYEVILTDHEGVDLVILAACETLLPTLRGVKGALGMTLGQESDEKLNIGQLELIVAGDEVVGLSRAFLSSGAQSVLGTLWQANPTAINELLVAMCKAHKKAGSWAMALKEAQCEILAESDPVFTLTYQTGLDGAHPWFWGAYQLIGRWR